jgi:hypothetical protein
MKKYLLIGFFFIGAITMLTMSLHFFQNEISGIMKYKDISANMRLGYIYLSSVLISSVMGLLVAQFAMGGIVSTIGFSILAVFWFVSAIIAITSIRKKDIVTHKKWMFISYGLTFAAITQRTLLLVPLLTDIEFIFIYRLSAWLPWILNTAIALYLFKKSERKVLIIDAQMNKTKG